MYEVPPPGFSPPIPAFLKIAHAHWPECFRSDNPPDDASDYYAAILHCALQQPELLSDPVPDGDALLAVSRAFKSVRKALSNGQICGYYLDEQANINVVRNFRHWATSDGLDDLLIGEYFEPSRLKIIKIMLEDAAIDAFLPASRGVAHTSAKGRDAFADRLRQFMIENPEPRLSKSEIWDLCAPGSLSKHMKQAAWDDAVCGSPAYKKAGPRRRHTAA